MSLTSNQSAEMRGAARLLSAFCEDVFSLLEPSFERPSEDWRNLSRHERLLDDLGSKTGKLSVDDVDVLQTAYMETINQAKFRHAHGETVKPKVADVSEAQTTIARVLLTSLPANRRPLPHGAIHTDHLSAEAPFSKEAQGRIHFLLEARIAHDARASPAGAAYQHQWSKHDQEVLQHETLAAHIEEARRAVSASKAPEAQRKQWNEHLKGPIEQYAATYGSHAGFGRWAQDIKKDADAAHA